MKISIIVPIYNVADYIEACMQSICQQTFKDFEVILVDDCGTDNSVAIAFNTLTNGGIDPTILAHNHNRGLSAARNTGLDAAQGEYVIFVDSDDQLMPQALELLYDKAQKTRAHITYGGFETFGDIERSHQPHGKAYVMAWNKLCLRSFLVENHIRFIEGLIHEDCPWSFEIECKTRRISMVPDITYRYLIRKGGLQTAGEFDRHFKAYCIILQDYEKSIRESILNHRFTKENQASWFEVQKALYFSMTKHKGSSKQLREIYHLIRQLHPQPKFNKEDSHYWMPEWLGLMWYKKFHKYHLC